MLTAVIAMLLPGGAFLALAYAEQFARGFSDIRHALTPERWRH